MALTIDPIAGWQQPTLEEVRTRVVEIWRGEFGDDSPTDSTTSNGQIIDVIAIMAALVYQGTHATYLDGFVRSARGAALDQLLSTLAFPRRDDTPAEFDALIVCVASPSLPETINAGALILNGDTSRTATTDESITLETSTLTQPWGFVLVTASTNGNYTVTIDGTPYTFVASGNTIEQIRDGLLALINAGADADAVAVATNAMILEFANPGDTWSVSVGLSGRVAAKVRATATAVFVGDFGGAYDLALSIANADVEYVFNLSDVAPTLTGVDEAIAGSLRETDGEYLGRYLGAVSQDGTNAPRLALALSQLDGVEFVKVYENDTDVTDGDGRPPHSVEAVVLGGVSSDIVQTLATEVAAGIQTYGLEAPVSVNGKAIEFTRPISLYLWIDIVITTGEDYDGSGDPEQAVIDAVITYLTSKSSAGYLRPGRDVYRLQIASAVAQALAGVQTCTVELDTTFTEGGPPTYTAADITVPVRSIAIAAASRVQVTIT